MIQKISILFLIFTSLFSLEIDVNDLVKKVKKNPNDIFNRLILAKYYLKNNQIDNAKIYLNEILKKDPKNKSAKLLLTKIKYKTIINKIENEYGDLNKYIDSLYQNQKYDILLKFYKNFPNLNYNQDSIIKISRVAMWKGDYDLSLNLLSKLKNEKNLDVYEIKAYDYLYNGNIKKANYYFKTLYYATGNKNYALKAIETDLQLSKTKEAQKILYSIKHSLKKEEYNKLKNKINEIINKQIIILKKEYNNNPSFKNLEKLAIAEFQTNHQKAISLVKNYIKQNPTNSKAKIFLAKLLSWDGNLKEAQKYLNEFIDTDNYDAKLLYGKILGWNGIYDKAIIYLSDVYENGNESQKYEALKNIAFIKMWQNKNNEAKKIFLKLLKQNPKDIDIKEALMMINRNIKPLIKKYSKLYKKYPNNEEIVLKLADLYYMDNQLNKAALLYEKYIEMHPDKIETYKILGDIYLKLKQFYKGFGDWESYAAYKNDKKTYLELAKRYYWNGFNKQALEILDKILKKSPKYKPALKLKAQILKVNPRYVLDQTQNQIGEYFNNKSKQILIYADRSYFNGLYVNAAKYYKQYLFLNPDDNNVRERYAFSLENSGNYSDAAGEFFNLLWYKNTPLIKYHYAYNLQKSGKTQKALKIYKELLNEVPQPIPEKIKKFLNEWKKAWESMDFNKYAAFYDDKLKNNLYWRLKKQNLFKKSWFISVGIYDPVLLQKQNNIYKIRFYQVYASKIKKDKGYKTLTIKCSNEQCKILKESWQAGKYTPFNPNNSIKKFILQNIEAIKKGNFEKKFLKKNPKQTSIPNNDFIPLNKILNKKSKVVLAVKVKRESNATKIEENLNIVKLKSIKLHKKKIVVKELPKEKKHKLFLSLYHFQDNQKTLYNQYSINYLQKVNTYYVGIYNRFFHLKQNSKKHNENLIALDIEKFNYDFKIGYDKAKNGDIFAYFHTKMLNYNLTFLYENLVYTRRTLCSLNHKRFDLQFTKYIQLTTHRALWYSLEGERIDDENLVFTPQFDYEFYYNTLKNNPYNLYISGWYQFNKKNSQCYYSPYKTDSNTIGIKFYPKNKFSNIMFKCGVGYSFFDNSFLYVLTLKAEKNLKLFNLLAQCNYSNTKGLNKPGNYKSYECWLNIGKLW